MSWVDVRNFDRLMENYQRSSQDGTMMPGLGAYLQKIINQNQEIIQLLEEINNRQPRKGL